MANKFIHPDKIVPDKTYTINGVVVKDYLIANHNINNLDLPSKRSYPLKGITIHNTSTLGKDDDGKWYTASTINGNMGGVFVHYYVDCNGAWHNLTDDYMNWSCSDGIGYAGGNAATIAIEVIMSGVNGDSNSKAMDNAERLAAYLLWSNNLTAEDLYTHSYWINTKIYKATGTRDYLNTLSNPRKNCPVYIIPQWDIFKRGVDSYIYKLGNNTPTTNAGTSVKFIYQAISHAAIRTEPSKNGKILSRVVKYNFYPADWKNDDWFEHAGTKTYSKLYDGGSLFAKVGEYRIMTTTAKLNIRVSPTLQSDILTIVSAGTQLYVWNCDPVKACGYTWYKVVINNKVGYVAGEYLK